MDKILEEVDASIQVGGCLAGTGFSFLISETSDPFPAPLSGQKYTIQSDHLFEEPYQAESHMSFLIIVEVHRIYLKELWRTSGITTSARRKT